MRLSCSFREDISPRFIPSQRNRQQAKVGRYWPKKSPHTRWNEEIDANLRDLDGHVFCEAFVPGGPIDSPRGIPAPRTDLSPASGGRRLELSCRSDPAAGVLGPHQIHSSAAGSE